MGKIQSVFLKMEFKSGFIKSELVLQAKVIEHEFEGIGSVCKLFHSWIIIRVKIFFEAKNGLKMDNNLKTEQFTD